MGHTLGPRRVVLDALAEVDATASVGRVGCVGTAPAEAWFGGFKKEVVHPIGAFTIHYHAQVEIARYIRWSRHHPAPLGTDYRAHTSGSTPLP